MEDLVPEPETLAFKLSSKSRDYALSRSVLLDKIRDASPESLPGDMTDDKATMYLKSLWESKDLADVHLIVNSTKSPAHKFVLAAASDYFRVMFSGDFAEAGQSQIELQDITTSGLELILDAIYNGNLALNESNVINVLDTADKIQVQEIAESCEDFLICEIDTANCFELLQLSEKYTLPKLNRNIETFIISNFETASQHILFPNIQSDALITFLSNDELDLPEIDIFKAAMTWFKVNPTEEKLEALCEVMKEIRFTYMMPVQIEESVLCETIITQNSDCEEMIKNKLAYAVKYRDDVHSRPLMEASNLEQPRGKLSVAVILPEPDDTQVQQLRQPALPLLFLFSFSSEGPVINMADINVFQSEAEFAVFSMNVMQMGNCLFFLGAKQLDAERKEAKMVLLRYNVQSGEWITLCEPPFKPVVVSASIIHNSELYAFGGATYMNTRRIPQNTFQDGCYKYSIASNTWATISNYPHAVAHPAACVLGDEIYIIGGGGATFETRERDKVNAYNTTTNEWKAKCSLNKGRSGHRVCCVAGKIYAIGGRNPYKEDIPECEVNDAEENTWTVLSSAPVPQPVASFNLLVVDDRVIILGGGDDDDEHKTTIQTFSTSTLTWTLYNWKDDQPHFVPMGSIHNLPLVRARTSCCTKGQYEPHVPVVPQVCCSDSDHNFEDEEEYEEEMRDQDVEQEINEDSDEDIGGAQNDD